MFVHVCVCCVCGTVIDPVLIGTCTCTHVEKEVINLVGHWSISGGYEGRAGEGKEDR